MEKGGARRAARGARMLRRDGCGPGQRAGAGVDRGAAGSVTLPGSPYRYTALSPGTPGGLTVLARVERRGGRVSRWWYLPGSYLIPAVAYDGTGGGLSADGRTLVLRRFSAASPPRQTRFAVLGTGLELRHPLEPGQHRPRQAISRITLPGDVEFDFKAISPHGSTVYLAHYLQPRRGSEPRSKDSFEIRALEVASGALLPAAVINSDAPGEPMLGVPISQATSADGGHAYTLYDGSEKTPFIEALATITGNAFRLDLPGLGARHNLFLLHLRLANRDRRLELLARSRRQGGPTRRLMSIDTARLAPGGVGTSTSNPSRRPGRFLSFTRTPRFPGNLLLRAGVVAHSIEGRPITLRQIGDPRIGGRLLAFGCIHGDECGVAGRAEATGVNGCPDPGVDAFFVPNLDPDGTAAGSRLNARGVDLNRNFPSGWRPIEGRGDPQYSGPHPFSEPEARLAARLVRAIRPKVTIWFHQDYAQRPFVRAWGPSRAAARRFARLARMPFRAIPWPAGTAPNWQNHRFPGTASFVVELPRARPGAVSASRLNRAIDLLAREVAKD
ncbi:MAG: M14 family zinc carboxypeptidase [Solirubrobacterales bacterium]